MSGKLPSQTVVNPRENASVVTLKSGKNLETPPTTPKKVTHKEEEQRKENTSQLATSSQKIDPKPSTPFHLTPHLFPSRFTKSKKEEQEREILETFHKVEMNRSLLEANKQVPWYAKFLKELCTLSGS